MKKFTFVMLLLFLCIILKSQTFIQMDKEAGIYTIPCEVNGLKLRFILDTGASSVSISLSEVNFMLKNGYLNTEDIIGSGTSQIADGSIVENTRIILRDIKIGDLNLSNIEAMVVHNMNAPLLFGQSAIQKLGKFYIDGDKLIINKSKIANKEHTIKLELENARTYYNSKLFDISAKKYIEVANISTDYFEVQDYKYMGEACLKSEKYKEALIAFDSFLNLVERDIPINVDRAKVMSIILIDTYCRLAQTYLGLGNNYEAISYGEKSEKIAEDNKILGRNIEVYYTMGESYLKEKRYSDAASCYMKSFNIYCSTLDDDLQKKIKKGKIIKEKYLGDCCYKIAMCHDGMNAFNTTKQYLKLSSEFGDERSFNMYNSY